MLIAWKKWKVLWSDEAKIEFSGSEKMRLFNHKNRVPVRHGGVAVSCGAVLNWNFNESK